MSLLKILMSMGSQKEEVFVHGQEQVKISDLKREINKIFKIPIDEQFIIFKGNNLHEYWDETPVEMFGLGNNCQISIWSKNKPNDIDLRLPKEKVSYPKITNKVGFINDLPKVQTFSEGENSKSNQNDTGSEILKIEIQHGSDRHQIILRGQNQRLTVSDLQKELEKLSFVPIETQRIYFRSQELTVTPFKLLKDFDIKNNNVIRLVGEPSKTLYSNFYFGNVKKSN